MLQSFDGGVSPILDSHTPSDRFAAHPAGSGDTPRASYRSGRRRETGEILEVLMRFINHHITPLNIAVSEVLEKAVLIAKHLITVSWHTTSFFPSAGRGFTTLLRLGFGPRLPLLTCPQAGLIPAFCSCPPTFALDFLHPRPRGRKLVLNFL